MGAVSGNLLNPVVAYFPSQVRAPIRLARGFKKAPQQKGKSEERRNEKEKKKKKKKKKKRKGQGSDAVSIFRRASTFRACVLLGGWVYGLIEEFLLSSPW